MIEVEPVSILKNEHLNSVDSITVNAPKTQFATGSHDKTIKVWDTKTLKCAVNLTDNKEGIWCVNYHPTSPDSLISASPEGIAKVWDLKSKKASHILNKHTKRCYWAAFN